MSQADIQRFVSDLKENQVWLDEVKSGAVGLASVVELAQSKGYDISVDEAKAYIREQASQDLSDDQLDAVAGGKGHHHHHHHHKSVSTYQNVATVTTEATVAETTTDVAAEVVAVVVVT